MRAASMAAISTGLTVLGTSDSPVLKPRPRSSQLHDYMILHIIAPELCTRDTSTWKAEFEALRKEFPVLERKTYLNSGSYCALANEVKAAFEAYMEDRLLVGANWDVWVTKNESVRALMAQRCCAPAR